MGWAAALHGGCAQRGLLDFLAGVDAVAVPVDAVVGVEVPDVAADVLVCEGPSAAGIVAVIFVGPAGGSVGVVPPRSGDKICRVAAGCKARSLTVLEGERWRPECKSRTSEGRVVDADKKSRTSEMVFEGLTFKGMAAVTEMSATPGVSLDRRGFLLTFTAADGDKNLEVVGRKRLAGSGGSGRRRSGTHAEGGRMS